MESTCHTIIRGVIETVTVTGNTALRFILALSRFWFRNCLR